MSHKRLGHPWISESRLAGRPEPLPRDPRGDCISAPNPLEVALCRGWEATSHCLQDGAPWRSPRRDLGKPSPGRGRASGEDRGRGWVGAFVLGFGGAGSEAHREEVGVPGLPRQRAQNQPALGKGPGPGIRSSSFWLRSRKTQGGAKDETRGAVARCHGGGEGAERVASWEA